MTDRIHDRSRRGNDLDDVIRIGSLPRPLHGRELSPRTNPQRLMPLNEKGGAHHQYRGRGEGAPQCTGPENNPKVGVVISGGWGRRSVPPPHLMRYIGWLAPSALAAFILALAPFPSEGVRRKEAVAT
jgi:hypothetical protein